MYIKQKTQGDCHRGWHRGDFQSVKYQAGETSLFSAFWAEGI